MSLRYKGARLSATPPTTTGGTTVGANAAPGIWTLDQQMKAQGQSAWPGAGNYIEDVFSTYLHSGSGTTTSLNVGVDLSTYGGLVWSKTRSGANSHGLIDTARGVNQQISTNLTAAQNATYTDRLTAFTTTGFTLGADASGGEWNQTGYTYVKWTFRKQAKFFDVVTYTGNGANRTISHNLGSVPGTIIIKRTDTTGAWAVYHRSLANTEYLVLNTTAAKATGATYWNSTTPTSTEFSLGTATDVNANAGTYVAYLFAHDAGGFGAAGTDNVISCGSFTSNASGNITAPVNLGYEPQFVLWKVASGGTSNWWISDNMRGMTANSSGNDAWLYPNLSNAEAAGAGGIYPTSTGFTVPNGLLDASRTYIYIAIRRGPMKTPTSGTSVFSPVARTGTGANATVSSGFITDLVIPRSRASSIRGSLWFDRMRGKFLLLSSANTDAELSDSQTVTGFDTQNGVLLGTDNSPIGTNQSGVSYINYFFRRAPGFFDVVCYSGDSTLGRAIQHNLAAIPELMIVKNRNNTENWVAYSSTLGNTKYLILNSTAASGTRAIWANTTPTSTNFYVGGSGVLGETNFSSYTYVAYLFATVAGVSKVGSYTGTGALQTVNCGFTSGARFVLIKRTDTTGDWWMYDSARGITSGNDPYLFLNATAAEVTGTNYVDTDSTGFKVTAAAPAGLNANGGTYIFLAIA